MYCQIITEDQKHWQTGQGIQHVTGTYWMKGCPVKSQKGDNCRGHEYRIYVQRVIEIDSVTRYCHKQCTNRGDNAQRYYLGK